MVKLVSWLRIRQCQMVVYSSYFRHQLVIICIGQISVDSGKKNVEVLWLND